MKNKNLKSKKLHILFIDFDDLKNPLLSGGQARATYEVSKRLVKSGHKVTILCSKFPGSKNRVIDGINYEHIGLSTSNLSLNSIAFLITLPFVLNNFKADVVFECFMAPISTCFSPLYSKVPVIGIPTMFEAGEFTKKYHLPFNIVESLGCKFYKYFLAFSINNKRKMNKYNNKIYTKIIPNGVSEDLMKVKTSSGNYAFFIGRIDITQKGLDLLIRACTKIKNKRKLKIIIAGNGPKSEEAKLNDLIVKNHLEKNITFVGRVDGEKKISLIANSSFGLYPSRFEDFPLVPLEYAAMNKPLVSFDIKGLEWVPENVSLKAKSFNTLSLAKAMENMINNRKLRNRMIVKCKDFAKLYGWNRISKEYEKLSYEVINMESLKGAHI